MRTNLKYYLGLRKRLRELKQEGLDYEEQDALAKLQTLARHKERLSEIKAIEGILKTSKIFGFIWW